MANLTWRNTAYNGPIEVPTETIYRSQPTTRIYLGVKRLLDMAGATLGLLTLLPLLPLVALAIRLDSRGPVLFSQTRVGEAGREFRCWKLRSMYIDAEARKQELQEQNELDGGVLFKMKHDPRITRVGKILRKDLRAEEMKGA